MKRSLGWIALSGAALTAVAMGMPQASAQSRHVGVPTLRVVNPTTTQAAGYAIQGAAVPASASASDSFKVPALNCTTTPGSGVGLAAVIATGTTAAPSATFGAVFALCDTSTGTTPVYEAAVVVNGTQTVATFAPAVGDKISVAASETATSAKAMVKDVTQAKSLTKSAAVGATNMAVLDGMVAVPNGTTLMPIPNFGTEHFTSGKIDGTTVMAAGAFAVDMKSSGGVLQIHTGALNATTGNAWSEIFKHT
jgi:hypothetical protein